jgi:hypothetical protein
MGFLHCGIPISALSSNRLEVFNRFDVTDVTNVPRMELSSAIELRLISKTHALWSWWALEDGNLATARKHAWLATRKQPSKQN